ncbi:MAG TPA: hypothetical protein DCF33_22040 [Saprospirales bacterium]|nr:hypothetical protein [Saprospirales bacterium]
MDGVFFETLQTLFKQLKFNADRRRYLTSVHQFWHYSWHTPEGIVLMQELSLIITNTNLF